MSVSWRKIKSEIQNLSKKHKMLLMVSGGADSMFMLDFSQNSDAKFDVIHFQHGIRENDHLEKELIEQYIQDKNIDCNLFVGYGQNFQDSVNLEAQARNQRWAFVNKIASNNHYNMAVTGHHLNDNIEQVFLDLMRGINHKHLGLQSQVKDGVIVKYKPFLTIPKSEILSQCEYRNIPYIEDVTNQDNHHERNWLRNDIIPQLMERRNLEKSMFKAMNNKD